MNQRKTPTPPPAKIAELPAPTIASRLNEWFSHELLAGGLILLLLAGLLCAQLLTADPLGSANDRSRWCTVWSLAVRGTYTIDEISSRPGWDTIDKVRHEGHFYSTKPPLFPTMLAGLYWTIKKLTGLTLTPYPQFVSQLILLLVNVLPFLIAMLCWWWLLWRLEFSRQTRLLTLGILSFGTLLTPFLAVLNNHTAGATNLMFALAAAGGILTWGSRDAEQDRAVPAWWYVACGFFSAFTCCQELPAALFGLCIFLILLRHDRKRTLLYFAPAAAIPIIAFLVTTLIATGGWKPFYMYYGTDKYVYEYKGVPSYWSNPQGLDAARDSFWQYSFHCLVGHHGVFSLTPLLLLMIPGYWIAIRSDQTRLKVLHILGLVLTVVIFAFYWKRTENYNYGGVSVALRWVLWLIPFWLLAVAVMLERIKKPWQLLLILCILGFPSLVSAWSPWNRPWQQPWLFRMMEDRGWIDYSSKPAPFPRPIRSWLTTLSDSDAQDNRYWVRLFDGEQTVLTITDGGPVAADSPDREIRVKETSASGQLLRSRIWIVDAAQVRSGADPDSFLSDWEDSVSTADRDDQLQFLRGMTKAVSYRPQYQRYLFTPARENAFACRRAAVHISEQRDERLPRQDFRSDLWLNEEVPFGLVQLQLTTTNLSQSELQTRRTWTLIDYGTKPEPKVTPEPTEP